MIFCKIFIKKIEVLFVITVISQKFVRYKHEILLTRDAKPNQEADFVLYDFVINVIVITEFDYSFNIAGRRLRKFDLFI